MFLLGVPILFQCVFKRFLSRFKSLFKVSYICFRIFGKGFLSFVSEAFQGVPILLAKAF